MQSLHILTKITSRVIKNVNETKIKKTITNIKKGYGNCISEKATTHCRNYNNLLIKKI